MSRLTRIVILAFIVRFIFAAFLYHPDIKSQHFHASYFSENVINIYSFIKNNDLAYKDTFNYPPVIYFMLGSWNFISGLIVGPGLTSWLRDWSGSALNNQNLYSYLLILKLPYLFAEVLLIASILSLVKKTLRPKLLLFWLLNPLVWYCIYGIGQFDILPTLATVASLLAFVRKKYLLVGILLAVGALTKTYPLLFLPLFFVSTKGLTGKFKTTLSFLIVYAIPYLYFASSTEFQKSVLSNSLGGQIFSPSIQFMQWTIPLFPVVYLLIISACVLRRTTYNLVSSIAAVSISLLIFTSVHAQWLIWGLPFITLLLVKASKKVQIFYFIWLFVFATKLLLISDQYIFVSMLSGVNFGFTTVPPLVSLLSTNLSLELNQISSLLFVISSIVLVTIVYFQNYEKN